MTGLGAIVVVSGLALTIGGGIWLILDLRGRGQLPDEGIILLARQVSSTHSNFEVEYQFKGETYRVLLPDARSSAGHVPISIHPQAPDCPVPVLLRRRLELGALMATSGLICISFGAWMLAK